ncbi:MAG: hypothetical protein EOO20_15080 [Chryseobacterium sp.]|jgi:hypothetical protein|nr:MAG: hypothetical protein EOO20_15080 [Chryseobacterium sp.]
MIKITHETPVRKLNSITVGDKIIDGYESQGSVVKIVKNPSPDYIEYKFVLHNKQMIYILSSRN